MGALDPSHLPPRLTLTPTPTHTHPPAQLTITYGVKPSVDLLTNYAFAPVAPLPVDAVQLKLTAVGSLRRLAARGEWAEQQLARGCTAHLNASAPLPRAAELKGALGEGAAGPDRSEAVVAAAGEWQARAAAFARAVADGVCDVPGAAPADVLACALRGAAADLDWAQAPADLRAPLHALSTGDTTDAIELCVLSRWWGDRQRLPRPARAWSRAGVTALTHPTDDPP